MDTFFDELKLNETDVDGAIERLNGDEALYISLLYAFLRDLTMRQLSSAIERKQWDEAFTAAHALKGLAGNLGFTPLFHAIGELVIAIRNGRIKDISITLEKTKRCYEDITNIIKANYDIE